MKILFEDNKYFIVSKPQGIGSQSDQTGDMNMHALAEIFLSKRDGKKTRLYVVHRLDRPVGGIIVYAKSNKAAAAFSEIIQNRSIEKRYLCVATGVPDPSEALLTHYLKKKASENVSVAVHKNNDGAKEARLSYKTLESATLKRESLSLIEVELETGRHHQIRVQMSQSGLPIWGDLKYHPDAKRKRNWHNIALWSYKLRFKHPYTCEEICIYDYPADSDPWSHFEYLSGMLTKEV